MDLVVKPRILVVEDEILVAIAHIALPVLYAGQRMRFPRQLIHGDLAYIERKCIEAISDAVITGLKQDLLPEWSRNDGKELTISPEAPSGRSRRSVS